jgi:putative PIN family toxin of toxin-antitoxin system
VKIVFDTNVLIAAFIAKGTCHTIVEYCLRSYACFTSTFILNELQEKLVERFNYTEADASQVIKFLGSKMIIVQPSPLEQPVCRDPDDDNVLATAFAAMADCLITGDKDLLVMGSISGIEILKPANFLNYEDSFHG